MSEKSNNPNVNTHNPNKFVVYGSVVLAILGIAGVGKRLGELNNPFVSHTPVPAESQPHQNYNVRSGDTESSIAARFGHPNDLDFENMLNKQLPKADQPNRTLQVGEVLRVPEK